MFRPTIWMMVSLVLCGSILSTHANAQKAIDEKSLVKKTLKVQAVDPDGNSIVGAVFKPFGLNTSYFWPEPLLGKPKDSVTDKEGMVSLEYPELFADSVQCKSVDCVVSHEEYVGTIERIPISENETQKVTLKKGVRFGLKAIEEDGTPVKERFDAVMSGNTAPRFRPVGTDGLIETKGAETGPHQVMLVQPSADSKTRFSDALFFHFSERDQEIGVVVDDIELLPGVRVFGELPANVKRPVKDGVVMACQRPLPMKDAAQQGLEQLMWIDYAKVDGNGTFEFSSMPRTGKIQIIAMCDGWVSPGEGNGTKGQTFDVAEQDLKIDLELVPTMEGVIEVKDEKGNPVEDADVGSWPNQRWEDYGSQILGQRWRMIDLVKSQLSGDSSKFEVARDAAQIYQSKTDKSGRAVIRHLPAREGNPFFVGKKGFKGIMDQRFPAPKIETEPGTETTERLQAQISVTLKKEEGE